MNTQYANTQTGKYLHLSCEQQQQACDHRTSEINFEQVL